MKLFLGIDGGGSKTRFALCDENGCIIAEYTTIGTAYRELGVDRVCALLKDGVDRVLDGQENVSGVCFGMPCYGENMADDLLAAEQIRQALAPLPITFKNDVAAAWAGSLAFESGIIILAGNEFHGVGARRTWRHTAGGRVVGILLRRRLGLLAGKADARAVCQAVRRTATPGKSVQHR